MGKPTIYDVAKEAGVSPATVSRVINQKGYIAPKTARRVEQAVRKLGYMRPFGSLPVSDGGSRAIGVLVPDIRYEHCTNIFYHIESVLSQEGYSCILCNANNNYEKALRDLSVLTQRKVQGLILVNSFFSSEPIKEWLRKAAISIPVVSALGYLDIPAAYHLLLDFDAASKSLIEAFTKRGKNQFALLQSKMDPGSVWMKHSFAGIAQKLSDVQHVMMSLTEVTMDAGYEAMQQLFYQYPNVNALVFDTTLPAIGACRYLLDNGIAIPRDVAICATDMLSISTAVRPRLACVDNHQELIGREAARTMLDVLSGLDRPHIMKISIDILCRDTL